MKDDNESENEKMEGDDDDLDDSKDNTAKTEKSPIMGKLFIYSRL